MEDLTGKYEQEYATHFVTALGSLEESLRDCEDSQTIINGFLSSSANFYDADRAYIIEADWTENIGINTHEWCREGVEYQHDQLQYLEISNFSRWLTALKKNTPIIFQDIHELKGVSPYEVQFFSHFGVSSLIAVPFSKRLNQGFIGVDNPKRYGTDPSFLFLMAYTVVSELNEIKLGKSLTAATQALNIVPSEVVLSCFNGLVVQGYKGTLYEDDFTSDLAYTMLAYLTVVDGHKATDNQLCTVLWPNDSNDQSARSLKNIAYRLLATLKIIGLEDLVIHSNGVYRFNPKYNVVTDTNRFESICLQLKRETDPEKELAHYHAAIDLYTGNLLPRLTDNIYFIPIITYYQGLYLNLVNCYIEKQMESKQYVLAHKAAKMALTFEPHNGNLNMYMTMLIYHQAGASSAKVYYASCKEILSEAQTEHLRQRCPGIF